MWEKISKSILYYFKNIQFALKTWRNAAEIARAYASSSHKGIRLSQIMKEGLLWVFVIAVLLLLSIVAFYRFSEMKKRSLTNKKQTETGVKQVSRTTGIERRNSAVPERDTGKTETTPPDTNLPAHLPIIVKPEVKKFEYVPPSDTSNYCILVANKAVKSLYVLQKHASSWRVVKEYDIGIGEQEGRKVTAGDKRTPEGKYFIVGRKENSELAANYGPLAYVLDYPNEEDRRAGRTGQGIWIHGTAPDSSPYQTRGCIEMENQNLTELASLLKSGIGTPVIILFNPQLNDIASVPDYRYCEEHRRTILHEREQVKAQCRQLLSTWKTAWESKNIKEYELFYDTTRFSGQGLDWSLWKERKLRTFGLYDTIAITIENIMVTELAEHAMIVKFLQHYKTNLNNIENGKKLSFEKIDDFWKITRESTCPKEELLL